MVRIGTPGRVAAAQYPPAGPPRHAWTAPEDSTTAGAPAGRALVVIDGGHGDRRARPGGRPDAAFLAQLIACTDPALRPPRRERARAAADLYAAAARRTA